MKLRNIDIIGIITSLDEYVEKKLPQKISYAITKNLLIATKENECYQKEFNKLSEQYKDYFQKDDDGNIKSAKNGIPLFEEGKDDIKEEYLEKLNELLNIEVDVELYYMEEEWFNYEDNCNYDVLTPVQISYLQRVFCK